MMASLLSLVKGAIGEDIQNNSLVIDNGEALCKEVKMIYTHDVGASLSTWKSNML